MVDLSPLPKGFQSEAGGISSDGRTIVGSHGAITSVGLTYNAVRWTSTGMQRVSSKDRSFVQATSSNGSVMVGSASVGGPASHTFHAFRWEVAGVVGSSEQDLGTLGGTYGIANATSGNGSVIVGMAQNKQGLYRAYRWTSVGSRADMVDLGTLGGNLAEAKGVSADGSVVVGGSSIAGDIVAHAFRWTSAAGVARSNMANWEKEHPKFRDAIKEAMDLSLAWWEDTGQLGMTRPGFNATAFIFQMKNRFREEYRDVQTSRWTGSPRMGRPQA